MRPLRSYEASEDQQISPFVPKGPIYPSQDDKKNLETRNGVIQAQFMFQVIPELIEGRATLDAALLLKLQQLAVNQIYRCAGHLRDGPVTIKGVAHVPPAAEEVPSLVEKMFDYLGKNSQRTAVHLAAYVMWRLNWIHPFFGGNGRTARAFSYIVLCVNVGFALPARSNGLVKTIPELIVDNRNAYQEALTAADEAWRRDEQVDLTLMERMISSLLAQQLADFHKAAVGNLGPVQ